MNPIGSNNVFQGRTESIYKVLLIGDPAVGKTELLTKFATNQFQEMYLPITGVKIFKLPITIEKENITINLMLWDVAGQPQFYMLHRPYFNGADGMILTLDITRSSTFSNINNWFSTAVKYGLSEIPRILVGVKKDENSELERKIILPMAKHLSEKLSAPYFEVSLDTGKNVKLIFQTIAELICKYKNGENWKETSVEDIEYETPQVPEPRILQKKEEEKESEAKTIQKKDRSIFEEKLNAFGDKVESIMPMILRIPDLVDQSLLTLNQKISTLESRFNTLNNAMSSIKSTGVSDNVRLNFTEKEMVEKARKFIKDRDDSDRDDKDDDAPDFYVYKPPPPPDGGDDRFPYPYVYKPPEPPDDIKPAFQVQRIPIKEKEETQTELDCPRCGDKLPKGQKYCPICGKDVF